MNAIMQAIQEYQCSGCVYGSNLNCGKYAKSKVGSGCNNHAPGTLDECMRNLYLGMPRGFRLYGPCTEMYLSIFETLEQQEAEFSYDAFNIPVWKYRNSLGHIFIRGLSPRINLPFLHIILKGDFALYNCLEITEDMLNQMD